MNEPENKKQAKEIVGRLIRATKHGKLKWQHVDSPVPSGFYRTEIDSFTIEVYKYPPVGASEIIIKDV